MDIEQRKITRIHDFCMDFEGMESRSNSLSAKHPSGLIMPIKGSDVESPALRQVIASLATLLRTLTETDAIDASKPFLLGLQVLYRRIAQDKIRQYGSDALCNNLHFDRHDEETSVDSFTDNNQRWEKLSEKTCGNAVALTGYAPSQQCLTSEKNSGKKPLNNKSAKIVTFTDLDGTLLDEKYSYQNVKPVIDQLLILNAAIVFCSSKTRAEIEFYRKKMRINDPFISENGSAIFIPREYFRFKYTYTRQTSDYDVIELGAAYAIVREKLELAKKKSAAKIIGFGDMTEEEIAEDSGLPLEMARLAKRREYDEPFRIVEGSEKEILDTIIKEGCRYTKGERYFHMLGKTDKGKAAAILKGLYVKRFRKLITYGIGDSPNDLPMLEVVDIPIFVKETSREYRREALWKGLLNQIRATISKK